MRSLRRIGAGACCLVLSLTALAACGSSAPSETSSNDPTSSIPAAPATTTTSAQETSGGTFCTKVVAEYNAAMETISSTTDMPTPAAFRAMIEAAQRSNDALASQAPDEIKDDVKLVVDASGEFYQALTDAGYDLTKVAPDALTKAQDAMAAPEVAAASGRITAYVKDTCGIDLIVPGSGAAGTS